MRPLRELDAPHLPLYSAPLSSARQRTTDSTKPRICVLENGSDKANFAHTRRYGRLFSRRGTEPGRVMRQRWWGQSGTEVVGLRGHDAFSEVLSPLVELAGTL